MAIATIEGAKALGIDSVTSSLVERERGHFTSELALLPYDALSFSCFKLGVQRFEQHCPSEIVDIGVTISKKPYFALYADELSLLPVGYANVDAHFIGWGGGQVGKTTHSVHSWGLLVHGKEELGWHRKDEGEGGAKEAEAHEAWRKREGFIEQGVGATMVIDDTVRLLSGKMFEGQNQPNHSLSCLHNIHLGWFGVVVSVRTLDILDFIPEGCAALCTQ